VLHRLGAVDEAHDVFRQWEEREPGNPIATHLMAACTGRDVPERASDGYVERVFDNFADGYDENLRDLEYRVPEWIGVVLPEYLAARDGKLSVLDAGCGTGLCATVLRPYAGRLTGVDLSSAMLERAREQGRYDELVRAELTSFLGTREAAHDLIVSADTLVYFGALEAVLGAASRALRPGGLLVFTAESAEDLPDAGYRLNAHGRYSHSREYIERAIAGAGLILAAVRSGGLRKEGGHPVDGWMVIARKPGED
jgi:predicted TPR repeat methyltransferase